VVKWLLWDGSNLVKALLHQTTAIVASLVTIPSVNPSLGISQGSKTYFFHCMAGKTYRSVSGKAKIFRFYHDLDPPSVSMIVSPRLGSQGNGICECHLRVWLSILRNFSRDAYRSPSASRGRRAFFRSFNHAHSGWAHRQSSGADASGQGRYPAQGTLGGSQPASGWRVRCRSFSKSSSRLRRRSLTWASNCDSSSEYWARSLTVCSS
jgi:hypothetical protein